MSPVNRSPSPVFKMDEDYQEEFNKVYLAVRNILFNYGSVSRSEICTLYAVDIETCDEIMYLIRKEFLENPLN